MECWNGAPAVAAQVIVAMRAITETYSATVVRLSPGNGYFGERQPLAKCQ